MYALCALRTSIFFVSTKALIQKSLVLVFVVVVTTTGRTKKSLLFKSRQLPFSTAARGNGTESRGTSFYTIFLQSICMQGVYFLFVWYFSLLMSIWIGKKYNEEKNKTPPRYTYSRYIFTEDIDLEVSNTNHLQEQNAANINLYVVSVWNS